MLWQLGWYKWPDGSLEMAAMGNSIGKWLDMSRECRDMQDICNDMDMTADTTIHVENIQLTC